MNMTECKNVICKNQTKKGQEYCGLHNSNTKKGTTTYAYKECHKGNVLVQWVTFRFTQAAQAVVVVGGVCYLTPTWLSALLT